MSAGNLTTITINRVPTRYWRSGSGTPLVILHGWGASLEVMAPISRLLANHFDTISIDLPGFGDSGPPPTVWGSEEYALHVAALFDQLEIINPIILGHSFGGKIALRLAHCGRAERLVLVSSAGVRPRRTLGWALRVYSFKTARWLTRLPLLSRVAAGPIERLKRRLGSADYNAANGVMRKIMVRVVNEDLSPILPKIEQPALLIWGELDKATPLQDGRKMERLLPNAGLALFEKCGHFPFVDQWPRFARVLASFLRFTPGGDGTDR